MNHLYKACFNGDVDKTIEILQTATLDEINRSESDGSTPLHAACRQNHKQIVEMLLEKDAVRRTQNDKRLIPIDETSNEEIKQLFQRSKNTLYERYMTHEPQLEWTFTIPSVAFTNRLGHLRPCNLESVLEELLSTNEFDDCEKRNVIEWFCRKAQETNDYIYLLKLYTTNTGFYKKLNRTIAKNEAFLRNSELIMPWALYFAGMLCRNSLLEQHRFHGQTYRGMRISNEDLSAYQSYITVISKAFLSTSKNRQIAEIFSGWNDDDPSDKNTFPVLCIYTITDRQSAINLEEVSEFLEEEEVLIMPSTVFQVINIQKYNDPTKYEIQLEEICDPNANEPVIPLPMYPSSCHETVSQ